MEVAPVPTESLTSSLATLRLATDGSREVVRERVHKEVSTKRRNNHIHMFLDTSGSMSLSDDGALSRIRAATQGVRALVEDMKAHDVLHFYEFNTSVKRVLISKRNNLRVAEFFQHLDAIEPNGGTALRDAVIAAVASAREAHQRDLEYGKKKAADKKVGFDFGCLPVHNIVILTDGEDTSSTQSMEATIEALQKPGMPLPNVFFVAVGDAAGPTSAVNQLARTPGGHVKVKEAERAANILDAFNFVRREVARYLVREVVRVTTTITPLSGGGASASAAPSASAAASAAAAATKPK